MATACKVIIISICYSPRLPMICIQPPAACGDCDSAAGLKSNRYQVADHRLNGSSSPVLTVISLSYGESKNSTPHRIKTPDPIEIKFGTVDYVGEGTCHAVSVMRAISPFVIFAVFDVQVLKCCR